MPRRPLTSEERKIMGLAGRGLKAMQRAGWQAMGGEEKKRK